MKPSFAGLAAIACIMLPACATDPRPAVGEMVADSVPSWLGGMPRRTYRLDGDAGIRRLAEKARRRSCRRSSRNILALQ